MNHGEAKRRQRRGHPLAIVVRVFERADGVRIGLVGDDKSTLRPVGQSGKGCGAKKNHRTQNDARQAHYEAPEIMRRKYSNSLLLESAKAAEGAPSVSHETRKRTCCRSLLMM
jgi:hypothetical protein